MLLFGPHWLAPYLLSNHHSVIILDKRIRLMWRAKDEGGKRDMHQKAVPCPLQMKDYSESFQLINKGNGKKAKYNMAGNSRSHNLAPKLVFRLFNMAMNNT